MSLDDVTAELTPSVRRARICVRGDLVDEIDRLTAQAKQAQIVDAGSNDPDQAPALWAEVAELRRQAEEQTREFVFCSVGKRAWSDLAGKHPPTDEQRAAFAQARRVLDHNPETFPYAAMAASCTEIDGQPANATVEGWRKLEERVTIGQWERLWQACLDANVGVNDLGKSVAATARTNGSATSSTSAAGTESPAPSSSDG